MSKAEVKTCDDDSKQPTVLIQDLVISILERLSFADFHRARCISKEWYYASKSCMRVTSPWIIMFPYTDRYKSDNESSCMLFNPRDHSSYAVRDLGYNMARSRCLASSGSWFLMSDHRFEFHLLHLFTRERIPLPSIDSIDGCPIEFVSLSDTNVWVSLNYANSGKKTSCMVSHFGIVKAVLWVDEDSRDYLVVWNFDGLFAYHQKGDDNNVWKVLQPLMKQRCVDMVCKESKLYVLTDTRLTVFDFSRSRGDSPMESASFKSPHHDFYPFVAKNLAVTLSGEVLIFISQIKPYSVRYVYKMDPKSLEWSIINSIGNEALLLDLGITVAAKDGVMNNSIYVYTDLPFDSHRSNSGLRVYHIKTKKVVQMYQPRTASYRISFKSARWFLNGCFKAKPSSVFGKDFFFISV